MPAWSGRRDTMPALAAKLEVRHMRWSCEEPLCGCAQARAASSAGAVGESASAVCRPARFTTRAFLMS